MELIHEIMAKAADGTFTPRGVEHLTAEVRGRERPLMRQSDRGFSWSDSTASIVRRIRAADGSPGVRTVLCGIPVSVYDAHPGRPRAASRAW